MFPITFPTLGFPNRQRLWICGLHSLKFLIFMRDYRWISFFTWAFLVLYVRRKLIVITRMLLVVIVLPLTQAVVSEISVRSTTLSTVGTLKRAFMQIWLERRRYSVSAAKWNTSPLGPRRATMAARAPLASGSYLTNTTFLTFVTFYSVTIVLPEEIIEYLAKILCISLLVVASV